jgi:hypothetical protein
MAIAAIIDSANRTWRTDHTRLASLACSSTSPTGTDNRTRTPLSQPLGADTRGAVTGVYLTASISRTNTSVVTPLVGGRGAQAEAGPDRRWPNESVGGRYSLRQRPVRRRKTGPLRATTCPWMWR